jgi:hypothetical protein
MLRPQQEEADRPYARTLVAPWSPRRSTPHRALNRKGERLLLRRRLAAYPEARTPGETQHGRLLGDDEIGAIVLGQRNLRYHLQLRMPLRVAPCYRGDGRQKRERGHKQPRTLLN